MQRDGEALLRVLGKKPLTVGKGRKAQFSPPGKESREEKTMHEGEVEASPPRVAEMEVLSRRGT